MERVEQAFVWESSPYNFAIVLTDSAETDSKSVWNHPYKVIHASVVGGARWAEVDTGRLKQFVESRKPCGWAGLSPFLRDLTMELIKRSALTYTRKAVDS